MSRNRPNKKTRCVLCSKKLEASEFRTCKVCNVEMRETRFERGFILRPVY